MRIGHVTVLSAIATNVQSKVAMAYPAVLVPLTALVEAALGLASVAAEAVV
jgi:hypothetical protein